MFQRIARVFKSWIGYFISCSVAEASVEETTRPAIYYFSVLTVGLVIVALVPWFTLVLPRLFLHANF